MEPVTENPRLLLYCWVANCFHVLVPKKRGTGFLRVPYGHHHVAALTDIGNAVFCDICGLDGALEFECSREVYHSEEARQAFMTVAMPALEQYYGFQSREVTQCEFWEKHPLA